MKAAPREVSKGIVVAPDRHSGAPCIAGRRLSAEMVVSYAHEHDTETLCDDYDLTPQQIADALAWDTAGRPA